MYSTCLFCHTTLGSNQVIEPLPIGRRLAFDGERGRLWIVCRRCGRWNLTPIEERWEAVEACERQFRGARLRASTPNIGLARLPEGLDLVRVGTPPRAELAAWRYATTFGRRRYQTIAVGGAGLVGIPAIYFGLHALGISAVFLSMAIHGIGAVQTERRNQRIVVRVPGNDGALLGISRNRLSSTMVVPSDAADGWALSVEYLDGPRYTKRPFLGYGGEATMTGEAAVQALGLLLPRINAEGGSRHDIARATRRVDQFQDAESYIAKLTKRKGAQLLRSIDRPNRLALEMLCHEAMERRAMEGELIALEAAWREAEEIAKIADDMFLPASITAWLARHRHQG